MGGSSAGRSEVGTDFPAGVSLLEPEHRERAGLELSSCRTPLLGDFELEGVCQLPDQSPPRDSVPQAEEAFWGQFGLGSRKRLLPAKEEAECQAKRACDEQRGDTDRSRSEEHSPSMSGRHLPSTGDNEVFISSESGALGWQLAGWAGRCFLKRLWLPGLGCCGAALTLCHRMLSL